MIRRPGFKDHFDVAIVDPDRVHLVSDHDTLVIRSRLVHMLAPHLDGRSTVEEIARRLEDRISMLDVEYGVDRLAAQGYLEEGSAAPPAPDPRFPRIAERATLPIRLSTLGGLPLEPFVSLLRGRGVPVDPRGDLHVVLTGDFLRDDLAAFAGEAAASGREWLPVNPTGTLFWIGPHQRAGRSPCHECLVDRLEANRRILPEAGGSDDLVYRAPMLSTRAVSESLERLASIVVAWATPARRGPIEGMLFTVNALSGRTRHHPVVARPGCPQCSARRAAVREPSSIVLTDRPKVDRSGGGHRAEAPAETLKRLGRHLSPITGLVPSLKQVLGGEGEVAHVWTAGNNTARFPVRSGPALPPIRSLCAGKGTDATRARLGAICEALERRSGIFRGDEIVRVGSYAGMRDAAIHPGDCLLFSDAQYRERDRWNETGSACNWIPMPLDEERPIAWTPVWSLTASCFRLLPTGMCYYAFPECEPFYRPDSNGCAAGSTIEEAILQGFLELVERDSVAIWWYHRLRRPSVRCESFDEPYVAALRDRYRGLGRDLHVLDLTGDLGIPAVAAVSLAGEEGRGAILGFGAHLDPAVAVMRALTEMNQFLPAAMRGEEVFGDRIADPSWLIPDPDCAPIDAAGFANRASDDLRTDVETCVRIASAQGLDVLVLDQTREEIGLSTVKVIVPGLRPFWARFGPGRLWQVPLAMGWIPGPPRESDLNPVHISF